MTYREAPIKHRMITRAERDVLEHSVEALREAVRLAKLKHEGLVDQASEVQLEAWFAWLHTELALFQTLNQIHAFDVNEVFMAGLV